MPAAALQPRPGLHYCIVRDHAVFLDVRANRYFALSPALDDAFRSAVEPTRGNALSPSLTDRLIAMDILRPADGRAQPAGLLELPEPAIAFDDRGAKDATIAATAALAARYFGTLIEVRARPFGRIIESRERKAPERDDASNLALAEPVLAAMRCADRILSPSRRCLPRSIAIFDALVAAGFRPNLVIGVSHLGFAAHCWLQHGSVVLNDDPDNVRRYAPILVI